jgi:hypothetical protein
LVAVGRYLSVAQHDLLAGAIVAQQRSDLPQSKDLVAVERGTARVRLRQSTRAELVREYAGCKGAACRQRLFEQLFRAIWLCQVKPIGQHDLRNDITAPGAEFKLRQRDLVPAHPFLVARIPVPPHPCGFRAGGVRQKVVDRVCPELRSTRHVIQFAGACRCRIGDRERIFDVRHSVVLQCWRGWIGI